jgi:hypothetical protein
MRGGPLVMVLVSLLGGGVAEATHCAPIEGGDPALGSVEAEERLRFLQAGLRAAARRARIWSWGWGAGYATVASAELVAAQFVEPDLRPDAYVGAAAATIGVLAIAIVPPKVMGDQRRLDRRLADARPDEDRCALLADAERYLLRGAASERLLHGWFTHVGNAVVNLAVTFTLGFGWGRWATGAPAGAIGATVGEIQIFTAPRGSIELLARYRRGDLGAPPSPTARWFVAPLADGWGLQAGLLY